MKEREIQNLGFPQMRSGGVKLFCLSWHLFAFCGTTRGHAVCHYIMGPFSGWSWWRHQMETFPRNWPFVRGIHRSPVNSTHKGQSRGALMFSLICVWINDWVNNREAGDLRRHHAHYDVTIMCGIGILHWVIAYRRCDKHDNVQFTNSWEKYAASFEAGFTDSYEMHIYFQFVYATNINTIPMA